MYIFGIMSSVSVMGRKKHKNSILVKNKTNATSLINFCSEIHHNVIVYRCFIVNYYL